MPHGQSLGAVSRGMPLDGQAKCRELVIKRVGIPNAPITARIVVGNLESRVREKVNYQIAARHDFVVRVHATTAEP